MHRRNFLISGAAFALVARAQTTTFHLDVAVTYTGEGTVDEGHKMVSTVIAADLLKRLLWIRYSSVAV